MDESRTGSWRNFRLQRAQAEPEASIEEESIATNSFEHASGTFFDAGATFEGNLKLTGDFRIDSEFRGELTTDGTILVGPSGSIEGNIEARQIEIEGAVVGNVTARRMLILRASGRLHGDIETACLEIEPRGFFQGGTKMLSPLADSRSRDAAPDSNENAGTASYPAT